MKFLAWDLGGQETMRTVWDAYYLNTDAIIYVIDSSDENLQHESREEFYKLLKNEELKNAVVLIFANKQDLPTAKKDMEIIEFYGFDKIKNHNWHLQVNSKGFKIF